MKRIGFLSLLLLLAFPGNGLCLYIAQVTPPSTDDIVFDYGYSGQYLGTVMNGDGERGPVKDDEATVEWALWELGYSVDLTEYGKSDGTDGDISVSLTYAGATVYPGAFKEKTLEDVSGTWSAWSRDSGNPFPINVYTVKGANGFALYRLETPQASGEWNTGHLPPNNERNLASIPSVSHFSGFSVSDPVPETSAAPVPEPGTLALFGIGLSAAVLWRRKSAKRFPGGS